MTNPSNQSSASPIDWEQFDMIAGDGSEETADIYREYLAMIPDIIGKINDHLQGAPAVAEIRALAHQLKGTTATFGFAALSQCAAALEAQAREDKVDCNRNWSQELRQHFETARDLVSGEKGLP